MLLTARSIQFAVMSARLVLAASRSRVDVKPSTPEFHGPFSMAVLLIKIKACGFRKDSGKHEHNHAGSSN